MSKNFKELNLAVEAKNTLVIGVIITLLLFPLLMFLPDSIARTSASINGVLMYFIVRLFQGQYIDSFFSNNGIKQSGLKVIGISIVFTIITLIYGILAYIAIDLFRSS